MRAISGAQDDVGSVGEFGLIARVSAALDTTEAVLLGPGDDAAVVAAPDGRVVASTDQLLEHRHFRRDWSSAEDVGHKAAARACSDIAAMGAVPTAVLVALATPGDVPLTWTDGLVTGLRDECRALGAAVVGGDVTAADTVAVVVTALGDLQGRPPVTLAGAAVGDVVAYVGRLGWAAAGLAVLGRGFRSPAQVVGAHRRPEPPYAQGPHAALAGATAMTDVSDGLVADLGHLADASSVQIALDSVLLPVPNRLTEVAAALNVDPRDWVLHGGDDYALVATFPAGSTLPADWVRIGVVREGAGVAIDGVTVAPRGHEHFR
ncbi:MAG: thiamine-phosphate kinase [Jatrophihabitans sp.]|uniref:thiamine-phosphate kinase n=1 Tax=Jatrophihabitans sp. TaxID=1932789 RepID=UPI003F7F20E5